MGYLILHVLLYLILIEVISGFSSSKSFILNDRMINSEFRHLRNRPSPNLFATKKDSSDDSGSRSSSISSIFKSDKLNNKLELSELPSNDDNNNQLNLRDSYIFLGLLFLLFSCNQAARQLIFYICDFSSTADSMRHMNIDLNFNKEQYAFLASFGFTVTFASTSLFAGSIADKYSRKEIAAFSCVFWSLLTISQGLATSYSQVLPLRALLGVVQAFFNPAAYTLLADYFPPSMLGQINGMFSSGIYLGGALSSLSIFLDERIGWRYTMTSVGVVGLVLAIITYATLPEPKQNERFSIFNGRKINDADYNDNGRSMDEENIATLVDVESMKIIKEAKNKDLDNNSVSGGSTSSSSRSSNGNDNNDNNYGKTSMTSPLDAVLSTLQVATSSNEASLLLSATALRYCAGFTIGIWKAPYIFAKFPGAEEAFASTNAAIIAIAGIISGIGGGYLADQLAKSAIIRTSTTTSTQPNNGTTTGITTRDYLLSRTWVPALGSLLAVPLWLQFLHADTPETAASWLFLEYLAAECWFGPTLASFYDVVGSDRRGASNGLFSLLTAVGNLAPVAVGALTSGAIADNLNQFLISTSTNTNAPDLSFLHMNLEDALGWVVGSSYFVSALFFTLAALQADGRIRSSNGSNGNNGNNDGGKGKRI